MLPHNLYSVPTTGEMKINRNDSILVVKETVLNNNWIENERDKDKWKATLDKVHSVALKFFKERV